MSTEKAQKPALSLTLDEHEVNEVLGLLDVALRDLRVEIHRTHTPDYRESLKQREALLQQLIEKVGQGSK
jgi:hypothetical protein